MGEILNLDFLLEPVKPAGKVVLLGKEYELMQADLMENFLTLLALGEKVQSEMQSTDDSAENQVARIAERMEQLRADLRSMVRVLVPGMSDELLREKFPKLEQLRMLFTSLAIEVEKGLPESVKKNSARAAAAATESAKTP